MKIRGFNVFAIAYRITKCFFMIVTIGITVTGCNTISQIFHKKDISATVCSHRWGMDMSFTQTSDRYIPNRLSNAAEFYGLKYNIPLTVFVFNGNVNDMSEAYQMGRMDFGVYVNSCVKEIEEDPKESVVNSIALVSKIRNGQRPSTLSYGCGKDSYKDQLSELFLMGRNSLNTNDSVGFTYYGNTQGATYDSVLTHSQLLSRPSTTRYFQLLKDNPNKAKEIVRNQIYDASKTHGFFTDFSHWQAYSVYNHVRIEDLKEHFENISIILDTLSVYRGSFNQIAEYYYARESVDNVITHRARNKIIVEIYYSKKEKIDYGLINVPVTIKLNTAENRKIKKDYKSVKNGAIRKMDDGNLVLDVQLDFTRNYVADTLEVSSLPQILDFSVPEMVINESSLVSDKKIKITIFEKKLASNDTYIFPVYRSLVFAKEHSLLITKKAGYDYFIGFISETNISGMVKWE